MSHPDMLESYIILDAPYSPSNFRILTSNLFQVFMSWYGIISLYIYFFCKYRNNWGYVKHGKFILTLYLFQSHAVRLCLFTAELRVQSPVISYEIHGGRTGTGSRFVPNFFCFLLLIIIPILLHTHLSPPSEVCDIGWGDMDCSHLTHEKDQWRALVNMKMELRVSVKWWEILE
jgi:hypothetical protein